MVKIFFAVSQNTLDGLIVGTKLVGAVVVSAVTLYIILKLIRIVGNSINRALYKRYLSKISKDAPVMSYEEYVKSISGIQVLEKPHNTVQEQLPNTIEDTNLHNTKASIDSSSSVESPENAPTNADLDSADTKMPEQVGTDNSKIDNSTETK